MTMARREVTDDDVKGGKYLKLGEQFPEPGSVFKGIYESHEPGTYNDKVTQQFSFKLKDGSLKVMSVSENHVIARKLLAPKMALKAGDFTTITRKADQNGYWAFDVVLDDVPKGKAAPPPPSTSTDDW